MSTIKGQVSRSITVSINRNQIEFTSSNKLSLNQHFKITFLLLVNFEFWSSLFAITVYKTKKIYLYFHRYCKQENVKYNCWKLFEYFFFRYSNTTPHWNSIYSTYLARTSSQNREERKAGIIYDQRKMTETRALANKFAKCNAMLR